MRTESLNRLQNLPGHHPLLKVTSLLTQLLSVATQPKPNQSQTHQGRDLVCFRKPPRDAAPERGAGRGGDTHSGKGDEGSAVLLLLRSDPAAA